MLPNYKNGSLVNLMSSIGKMFGHKSEYGPLDIEIPKAKNIVLLVIDGLGYDYVKNSNSALKDYLAKPITSVFPSTTATAVTTIRTGLAPQQHAFTGWFMYLKEIGIISKILPFTIKGENKPITSMKMTDIIEENFFDKINVNGYNLVGKDIVNSKYQLASGGKSKNIAYSTLNGFFRQLKKIIKKPGKKYIFTYWSEFDSLAHEYGKNSKKVSDHFKKLDKKLGNFLKTMKDTTLIITSDHGHMTTKKSRVVDFKDHPKLTDCLAVPVSGDTRVGYCFVKPNKIGEFENYVRTKLKNICELHKSEDLVKKNYFGLFKPNKKLYDRIGDYTLIMKENYIIGDKNEFYIGNHSGLSEEEMLVPLIVIQSKRI